MIIAKINLIADIVKALEDFVKIMIDSIPILIMGILLFLAGYLVAKIVYFILDQAFSKMNLDDVAVKFKLDEPMRILGIRGGLGRLMAKIVFYLIMLAVTISTTRNLGIAVLEEQLNRVLAFIPSLFSALLITLIGYLVAVKVKEVLINTTKSLGGGAGNVLGSVLYYFIMIMVLITAIDQMGIDTDLISKNILIIVAVVLIAGAVAYGHAARDIMRNMLASFYSKKNFHPGQRIRIKDVEGLILEIDNTAVTIHTGTSKIVLPSSELTTNYIEILSDEDLDDA